MARHAVSEAEIVDALFGGAGTETERRVREAVRTDLKAAAHYAEWERIVEPVRNQGAAMRRVTERIKARVARQLPDQRAAQALLDPYVTLDEPFGSDSLFVGLLGPREKSVWRMGAAVGLAALAALIAVGYAVFAGIGPRPAVVERLTGQASVEYPGKEPARIYPGVRLNLPAEIKVADKSLLSLRFPNGAQVSISEKTRINLTDAWTVRQISGQADYRVATPAGKKRKALFKVFVPQGEIADLGTQFNVQIADSQLAVVHVEEGRVRLTPAEGQAQRADAGQRAMLTSRRVSVEQVAFPPAAPVAVAPAKTPPKPLEDLRLRLSPAKRTLTFKEPLASLVKPQTITLGQDFAPPQLRKPVPFTSEHPLAGLLKTRIDGKPIEGVVACDQKLDGSSRIYFDANLNGDLSDDPTFSEGVDFRPGTPFKAGELGPGNMIWLKRPVRLVERDGRTTVAMENRIDYFNPVCLSSEVEIPASQEKGKAIKQGYLLLDIDSDGDFVDEGGSLAVWTAPQQDGIPTSILALSPPTIPSVHMGYRWSLSRDLSGEYVLAGEKTPAPQKALHPGDILPSKRVRTLAGEPLDLLPPKEGYLLLYVWSTWLSSCQRDVPFVMNQLFPRFHERGLGMLGISVDYREEDALNYIRTNKVSYPQVFNGPDLSQGLTAELGIDRAPLAILVDASGSIVSVGKSAEELWSFLDANLPQRQAREDK